MHGLCGLLHSVTEQGHGRTEEEIMAEAPRQYETFEASELFCAHCRQARPVRKHLLLVLPTGNKYDYRCAVWATSVGSKMDSDSKDFHTLIAGQQPRR